MAARVAKLFQPTLVLLDLEALGEADCHVLQALRSLDARVSDALFVCLAAEENHADVTRWLAAGCNRVLRKPLEPQALADVLAEARAVLEVEKSRVKDTSGERLSSTSWMTPQPLHDPHVGQRQE